MLQVCCTRVIRTGFNLSNYRNMNVKYKDSKCIYRFASTESVTKHDTNKQQNVSKTDINPILAVTKKLGVDINTFTDQVKKSLFDVGNDQLTKNITSLLDFGFNKDTVVQFIDDQPNLFRIKNTELNRLINSWLQLLRNEKLVIELLSKHPQLIEVMGPLVTERTNFLLPYFEKMNTVAIVLINSPNIIYENQGTLKAKLEFLHSHNIQMKKVANCAALESSLLEMKTRFMFLERAGVYKKCVDLHKKDLRIQNPTISKILCTDDKVFAEAIARLTLIEYEAFIDLYKLEQELLDEDLDEDYDSE